jgi:hypothetical protein
MKLFSWWGAFCFGVAAALLLSLLLSGCASGTHESNAAQVRDTWGRCDHDRIANAVFFCRKTTAEPVAGATR